MRALLSKQEEPSLYRSTGNQQLLDEVEQNIGICQWRADQLFAEAEG